MSASISTQNERDRLREMLSNVGVEGHKETGQNGLSAADLQTQLAEKNTQLLTLADEKEELVEKLTQAEAQVCTCVYLHAPCTCACCYDCS